MGKKISKGEVVLTLIPAIALTILIAIVGYKNNLPLVTTFLLVLLGTIFSGIGRIFVNSIFYDAIFGALGELVDL